MILTVGIGLWLVVAAGVGFLRGVRAGLVAVCGTLLAAVLLDLWAGPLAEWVRATFRPELPAGPSFAATALAFTLAALLLGYGGTALLPRGRAPGNAPLAEQALGALLGALNGALVAGYLLRDALASWGERPAAAEAIAGSALAALLVAWLPWYALASLGGLGLLIMWRLVRGLLGRPAGRGKGGKSVAAAPTLAEADRRLSDKIDQALGKK